MSPVSNAIGVLLSAFLLGACTPGTAPPDEETTPPASQAVPTIEPSTVGTALPTDPARSATATFEGATTTAELSPLPVCAQPGTTDLAMMELAFVADWDGDSDIYAINADGSNLIQFSNNPDRETNPVWSKDGQQIAFVTNARTAPRAYLSKADGSAGRVIAPDLELTAAHVELSPAGDLVAFFSLEDLYTVNILTGEVTLLTPGPAIVTGNPVFSPDGTKLLFTVDDDDTDNDVLFVVNADGTGLTELTSVVKSVHQPAWHPTEDKILFEYVESPSEGVALHVVSLDGLVQKLPIVPIYRASSAAWSPDGSMIGYLVGFSVLAPDNEHLSKNSLHVATADGSVDVELLTPADHDDAELQLHELVWAPDSRHLAYTSVTEGRTDLFVLNVCDGSSFLVVEGVDFYSTPSWRPLP